MLYVRITTVLVGKKPKVEDNVVRPSEVAKVLKFYPFEGYGL